MHKSLIKIFKTEELPKLNSKVNHYKPCYIINPNFQMRYEYPFFQRIKKKEETSFIHAPERIKPEWTNSGLTNAAFYNKFKTKMTLIRVRYREI